MGRGVIQTKHFLVIINTAYATSGTTAYTVSSYLIELLKCTASCSQTYILCKCFFWSLDLGACVSCTTGTDVACEAVLTRDRHTVPLFDYHRESPLAL